MPSNGPWVQVAALCEQVDSGPPLKLVGFVDKLDIEGSPGTAVPLDQLTLVICLWGDDLPAGAYDLAVQSHAPDSTMQAAANASVTFPSTGASGVNVLSPAPFTVAAEGVYWYDVLFPEPDGGRRLLSRFPLTVNYRS